MSEHEPPRVSDGEGDLRVEVAPLATPPGIPRPHPYAPTRRRRLWGTLLAGGVLLVVLALALGGIPSLRDALTANFAAPTPAPTAKSAFPLLGPVPTNCPPGNAVTTFAPDFPQGVAVDPIAPTVWVAGFAGPHATLLLSNTPTDYGYPTTLYLVASQHAPTSLNISIEGTLEAGNGALALDNGEQAEPLPSVTIYPNVSESTPNGYGLWPLQVYVPAAGCYIMNIRDMAGISFAAGSAASAASAPDLLIGGSQPYVTWHPYWRDRRGKP